VYGAQSTVHSSLAGRILPPSISHLRHRTVWRYFLSKDSENREIVGGFMPAFAVFIRLFQVALRHPADEKCANALSVKISASNDRHRTPRKPAACFTAENARRVAFDAAPY
jgi:hypothetical protein